MKTVASFSKPYEAHLLITRLEGSGIAAFARDENMVTLDWLASTAVGGVKVDVADEDYERALAVIAATATEEERAQAATTHARVAEIDAGIKRALGRCLLGAVPLGLIGYFVTPAPEWSYRVDLALYVEPFDWRPYSAAFGAIFGGWLAHAWFQRKRPRD